MLFFFFWMIMRKIKELEIRIDNESTGMTRLVPNCQKPAWRIEVLEARSEQDENVYAK